MHAQHYDNKHSDHVVVVIIITRSPAVAGMTDRTAHSRRSMQKLWRIDLAMLIRRDRGARVRIRISVRVRVNPVQITARYSHSSRKSNPNPNTTEIMNITYGLRKQAKSFIRIIPFRGFRGGMGIRIGIVG